MSSNNLYIDAIGDLNNYIDNLLLRWDPVLILHPIAHVV